MEAPLVLARSKLKISFQQLPPRLVRWGFHPSAADPLLIGLTEDGALCRIVFARGRKPAEILKEMKQEWPKAEFVEDKVATAKVVKQMFKAEAPLKLSVIGTKFQQAVWRQLLKIPAGKTLSYGEIAKRIKNPKAVRAVGTACGANPVALLVPCHRVIAGNGGLGGFGGGLPLKRQLLQGEGVLSKAA